VAVVAVLSTSKLNFEKLYIQRESVTKIMDCVYEVSKYDHHCHQVAKTLGILGFWQWQL
jgi:MOSC domain-containing protein YiiM